MFFNSFAFVFVVIFFFLVLFFFALVKINLIALAFSQIGIPNHYIFTALLVTLFGSFINIPVKKIPQEIIVQETMVRVFGFRYWIPVCKKKKPFWRLTSAERWFRFFCRFIF